MLLLANFSQVISQTKATIHREHKNTILVTQNKDKKQIPGLVAYYDLQCGNGMGLFSKNKISKEVKNKEITSKKKGSTEIK